MRGNTNNAVIDLDSAKRVLEFSTLGQNELFRQAEHERECNITWTRFENGRVQEIRVVSPSTWRLMRRTGTV